MARENDQTKIINVLVLGVQNEMVLIVSDCIQLANMYLTNKSTMNNWQYFFKPACVCGCVFHILLKGWRFYFGKAL